MDSVWIWDAERQDGDFPELLVESELVKKFLEEEYFGVSATKGIGKTFLIQVKRRMSNRNDILSLPKEKNGSEWGLERLSFNLDLCSSYMYGLLNGNKSVDVWYKIWQYSILISTLSTILITRKDIFDNLYTEQKFISSLAGSTTISENINSCFQLNKDEYRELNNQLDNFK